jgi:hypothetical protein
MRLLPLAEELKLASLLQQGQELEQLWLVELFVQQLMVQERLKALVVLRQQLVVELEQVLRLAQEQDF